MYWESRWAAGITPGTQFDAAGPSGCLLAVLPQLPATGRVLVPGAGRAYDAIALAAKGQRQVVALDIAPTACVAAKELLAKEGDETVDVVCGDFFHHDAKYDIIWDCTFLCALPPDLRESWADKSASLLADDGLLVTMVFPIGKDDEDGPPFALSTDIVAGLLKPRGLTEASVLELPVGAHFGRTNWGNVVIVWKKATP